MSTLLTSQPSFSHCFSLSKIAKEMIKKLLFNGHIEHWDAKRGIAPFPHTVMRCMPGPPTIALKLSITSEHVRDSTKVSLVVV